MRSAVPDDVAARHLAAITALAAEHVHLMARPTAAPSWGSRMRRVASLTIVKVAFAAGVAAATTGGLAAEGHLPGPVQSAVADGASLIGIDLPRPTPARTPTMSDGGNGDQGKDISPPGADADNPAKPPTGPSPSTNNRADADNPTKRPVAPLPSVDDRTGADNPARRPVAPSPSANDHASSPTERPKNGKTPEANGHDVRLTRRPASSPQGHEAGAEVRDTDS